MSTRRAASDRLQLAVRYLLATASLRNDVIAREAGLSLVDAQVLHLIGLAQRPVTPGEIRRQTALPSSTTTRVLDRLVAAGYVERSVDPADRRRVVVTPVPAKMAELAARFERFADLMRRVDQGFTLAELDVVARYLEAMRAAHDAGSAGTAD